MSTKFRILRLIGDDDNMRNTLMKYKRYTNKNNSSKNSQWLRGLELNK